ncbi:MAG: bifunctional tetrahydrofolate synthase/dihydrofolate synthase [Betaproteobacteria bacterium]|nr:bifunctional tetrahydrofolate synthase/dihydrofolate synthase [Betaproteobacteria bacterium]
MSPATSPRRLADWLAHLETLHPKTIALGLDRVRIVYQRLALRPQCPVIVVAGTNGKGSTCAMLESIYRAAHYRTGLYTSPHLLRYNERVRLLGVVASDAALCEAFAAVEAARGDLPLTYFEFGTLAAIWLFARAELDLWIMEVGLGGRLDAVNVLDADLAILTAIDVDHREYLGDTREAIGAEKAGILRAGRPAVLGDPLPPQSVLAAARQIEADLWLAGPDFRAEALGDRWNYLGPGLRRFGLPVPALRGHYQLDNAAAVLAAVERLGGVLPVDTGAMRQGLLNVEWPGRFQVLPGRPSLILDVAHNPQAARALAATLGARSPGRTTWALFGMLRDKDIAEVIVAMAGAIDRWLVADLPGPRGASAADLGRALASAGIAPSAVTTCASIAAAYDLAWEQATDADRIVTFGSFLTVAAVLSRRAESRLP